MTFLTIYVHVWLRLEKGPRGAKYILMEKVLLIITNLQRFFNVLLTFSTFLTLFWYVLSPPPVRGQGVSKIFFGGKDSTHQYQYKKLSTTIKIITVDLFWHCLTERRVNWLTVRVTELLSATNKILRISSSRWAVLSNYWVIHYSQQGTTTLWSL